MMKAIVKYKDGKIELNKALPIPRAGAGEAVVKVHYAGICKTDLRVADGSLFSSDGRESVVLGHEFSGEVVEVGPGCKRSESPAIGDFVVANPMLDDLSDKMLGKDANGCFAEYIAVPCKNLFLIERRRYASGAEALKLDAKLAAYTEPVAAARGVAPKIPVYLEDVVIAGNPNDRIAKLLKFCIECPDNMTVKRRIEIVEPERLLAEVKLGTRPHPPCIIECCPSFVGRLLKALMPGGTLILKSRGYVKLDDVLVNDIVMKEARLIGAKYESFYRTMDFMQEHKPELLDMIDKHDFKLEEFEDVFARARMSGAKKVMFKCVQQLAC